MTKGQHYWIEQLGLQPHSEGGYYKEVLRAEETTTLADQRVRPHYTSIYFLLTKNNPSHFHRLKADEVWYFHAGQPLTIHLLTETGNYEKIHLGDTIEKGQVLQAVVPKGVIFGSSVQEGDYSLVSCMVAPGFDYRDFELFTQAELLPHYPEHAAIIQELAYAELPVAE